MKKFFVDLYYDVVYVFELLFVKMSSIPNDLLLHFFYGAVVSTPLIMFYDWAGILLCLFVAAFKEVVDYARYDSLGFEFDVNRSLLDVLFTVIPSILIWAI